MTLLLLMLIVIAAAAADCWVDADAIVAAAADVDSVSRPLEEEPRLVSV